MGNRILFKRVLQFIWLLLSVLDSVQIRGQDLSQIRFYGFPGKGLPSYGIHAVYQDGDHFMWIGSVEGLFRFDGQEALRITLDTATLKGNEIFDIAGHPDSAFFWISGEGAVGRFYSRNAVFEPVLKTGDQTAERYEDCTTLDAGSSGTVWAICGNALFRLSPALEHFEVPADVLDNGNFIFDITEVPGNADQLYLATFHGTWLFDGLHGGFLRISPLSSTCIVHAGKHGVLTGNQWESGITYLNTHSGTLSVVMDQDGMPIPPVKTLLTDKDRARIAVTNGGIFLLDTTGGNVLSAHVLDPRLRYFSDGWVDVQGNLWVTTASGLMTARVNARAVQNFLLPVDAAFAPDNLTNVIEREDDLLLQFVNEPKLYRWNKRTRTFDGVFPHNARGNSVPVSPGDLLTVMPDHLLIIKEDASQAWYPPEFNSGREMEYGTILQQDTETYWIGTRWHGVFRLDAALGTFEHFNEELQGNEGSGNNMEIRKLFTDRDGNIWIGSRDGFSVHVRRTGRISAFPYSAADSLRVRSAKAFVQDYRGMVWIADGATGMYAVNPEEVERGLIARMSVESGLIDDRIWGMTADAQGVIWMSTLSGLQSWNPMTGQVALYGEAEGILTWDHDRNLPNLFPGYIDMLDDGNLLVGYRHGFALVNLQHLSVLSRDMELYFTSVRDMRDDAKLTGILKSEGTLHLRPHQNSIRIGFSAIDYSNGPSLTFEYFMEGLENQWMRTSQRSVNYGHLRPGRYKFHLRIVVPTGQPRQEIDLTLHLPSPWWATWWMYLIYAGVIGSGILTLYSVRMKRERAEREALRLREMDALKNDLYGEIAHEFRTPLTLALYHLDRASGQAGGMDEKELMRVRSNVHKLVDLTNAVQDLSDLASDSIYVAREEFDLIPFLKYLTESFRIQAENEHKSLRCHAGVESYPVQTDRNKLQTILENLVSNALKFTHAAGSIEIGAREVGESMVIFVKDDGVGIASEDIPRIFDRFYRVDSSISGQGIGLTLAQKLAGVIGGTLTVNSEKGKGSEFLLMFPSVSIRSEKRARNITYNGAPSYTVESTYRILIIEDQSEMADYIRSVIQYAAQVTVAHNATRAREVAFDSIPDLILSDIVLPDGNGLDLCTEFRADPRTSHVPVVIVTGKRMAESRIEALERGAHAILSKPFRAEELNAVIQQLQATRSALHAYYRSLFTGAGVDEKGATNALGRDPWVELLQEFIQTHLQNPDLGVTMVCQAFRMSKSNLHRKLSALTGQSLMDIIHRIRLLRAKELLMHSDLRISEIAYDCGFSDPAYFGRLFRRDTGKSPSAFRSGYQ